MDIKSKNRKEANDTKSEILENLLSKDLTALDLADILDINESAVRRHMNQLKSNGLVETYFEKAEKGRPKKYFSITDEGKELFPKQIQLLLRLIIKNLRQEFDDDVFDKMANLLVQDLLKKLPDIDERADFREKIESMVQGFDELGFYASYLDNNESHKVRYKNCAFGNLSKEEALWLCNIHQKVIEKMLDHPEIKQEKSMINGDQSCIQRIGE